MMHNGKINPEGMRFSEKLREKAKCRIAKH